jgi:glutaminyl-peptide cyclotransferase
MANLILRWNLQKKERILLCAHYDTLPFPLRDQENPRGTFLGANDNASGVAVLMELAHDISQLHLNCGIEIVFFDAEEFMFTEHGRFFIGSEYFAREYVKKREPHYRWGILLDMVGGKNLQLYQEQNSLGWTDTRPLVQAVWATAQRLGVLDFVPQKKYQVEDDHVRLHDLGQIPCIDIIDFDYPPWHTQGDTPEQCSALSLAKVGWVLREWLKTQ